MRSVVVGADGFAGRWLVRHLSSSGDDVTGLVGSRYQAPLDGASRVARVDVRAYAPMARAIASARPEALYFLAAVSTQGGRDRVADAARVGLVGAIHALTACAELSGPCRFVFVSSSHVYGDVGSEPISEATPARPTTLYGAAKLAAEQALLHLGPASGIEVVVARAFNHIGPGQAASFLVPTLVDQLRGAAAGEHVTVTAQRLNVVRDLTDVRDVVAAYRVLGISGVPGEIYNVASGQGWSVRDLVMELASIARVTADLHGTDARARIGDPHTLIGDAAKARSLGWQPRRAIGATLRELLS